MRAIKAGGTTCNNTENSQALIGVQEKGLINSSA